jgi:hypothetical protein
MSFEFDENKLANPPIKSDQEAITSFWGIYRWPFKKYNRYSQLEGLEQTADETKTMARALRFISCAKELGLSIDGGLGWLAGPDINQSVIDRGEKVAVFGESRFVPEPKPKSAKSGKVSRSSDSSASSQSSGSLHSAFERMLHDAGYRDENIEPSVRMMLETEELAGQTQNHSFFEGLSSTLGWENLRRAAIRPPASIDNISLSADAGDSSPLVSYVSEDDDDIEQVQPAISGACCKGSKPKAETHSLKPNDLTNAQREMLLEIEWAQRAFMQSYAIAVIDNPVTFKNIETLTIARLPNRHLPILRREDFWDSLPQLKKLSLAIIPDWREVIKLPTSWVQDVKLAPSQSVNGVYQILQEQISHRKNIKTLHFEWLCGGEYSPGLFSRNQHILAAPLVFKAMDMVNRATFPPLLLLPHVEDLYLKNCWISPHIMSRFGLSMRKCALQSITLDSVSLTASLALNAQPHPVTGNVGNPQNAQQVAQQVAQQAAANNFLINFQGLAGGQNAPNALNVPNALAPPVALAPVAPAGNNSPSLEPEWLETPRIGSWAHIIDSLTPGITLAAIRHARDIGPDPLEKEPTRLAKLVFKSCGYVRLPLDFDQTALDAPDMPAPQAATVARRVTELEPCMMKPHDPTLGVVVNQINAVEVCTLENAWNMTVGWTTSRAAIALEAQADGISNPGQGRFDGVIEVLRSPSSSRSKS